MLLVIVCLFGFVISTTLTAPAESTSKPAAEILHQESEVDPSGKYNFSFESSDGIKQEQSGEQKEIEPGKSGEVNRGSYSYTDNDGNPVKVSYVADENGFQVEGNILPQAPPIPEPIARALKFIEEHPPPPEKASK